MTHYIVNCFSPTLPGKNNSCRGYIYGKILGKFTTANFVIQNEENK